MKVLAEMPPTAVPIQGNTFQMVDGGIRLVASRCTQCEGIFFPKRAFCGRCGSSRLRDEQLSSTGTVETFSLIDRKGAISKIEPPYVQACIAMPEGLNVYSVLADVDIGQVQLNMPVIVCLAEIERDADDRPVVAYAFRAAGLEDA